MGPVNWLAVVAAAVLALASGGLWYGPLFGRTVLEEGGPRRLAAGARPARTLALTLALLLVSAAMMGHMFARLGEGVLQTKPWLYFMMSGGLAAAFVIPSLWISYARQRQSARLAAIDAGYWIVAYLAMGGAFWLFG